MRLDNYFYLEDLFLLNIKGKKLNSIYIGVNRRNKIGCRL